MKSVSSPLAILALLLAAACAGPSAPVSSQGVTPTTGGQATPVNQPTQAGVATPAVPPAPQPGGAVATVTLTGGPDAGTYTGNENPNCSVGIIGPGGWGTQYSTTAVDANGLGSIQLVSAAPGKENDPDAFFDGVSFLMTVTIGPSLGEGSREYEVRVSDDDRATGTGSAQVTDGGTTAVIHATAMTEEGVGIDATVNCPSVIRQ